MEDEYGDGCGEGDGCDGCDCCPSGCDGGDCSSVDGAESSPNLSNVSLPDSPRGGGEGRTAGEGPADADLDAPSSAADLRHAPAIAPAASMLAACSNVSATTDSSCDELIAQSSA